jgi:hypothetical protein
MDAFGANRLSRHAQRIDNCAIQLFGVAPKNDFFKETRVLV